MQHGRVVTCAVLREAADLVISFLGRYRTGDLLPISSEWLALFIEWGFRFHAEAGFPRRGALIIEEARVGWVLFYDPALPEAELCRQLCHEAAEYVLAVKDFMDPDMRHRNGCLDDRHPASTLVADLMYGPAAGK